MAQIVKHKVDNPGMVFLKVKKYITEILSKFKCETSNS